MPIVDIVEAGGILVGQTCETFEDADQANRFIREAMREAESAEDGLTTEIYVLEHHHEMTDDECSCVQYLADHSPAWTHTAPQPRKDGAE